MNSDTRKNINFDLLGPQDINVEKLKVDYGDVYHEAATNLPLPTSRVLFTSVFKNATDLQQTYSLRTERQTTATRRVQVTNGLTQGTNLRIKIAAPKSMASLETAFKDEVTCSETGESTSTEQLLWSLNTEVSF